MMDEGLDKTVLLVDDDPRILEYLSEALSSGNDRYGVITAKDGKVALDILENSKIAMVVTDLNMPEITGLELLSEIRKRYDEIPVIIMTGYGSPEVKSRAKDLGCLHFVEKPFASDHLKSMIGEGLKKKADGFVGTLKQIHLIDLIQMCCQAGMSMVIRVLNNQDKGVVVIENGEIVHSICGASVGEDAFLKILGWKSGEFETLGSLHFEERTIHQNSQYLLMEAARIVDEHEKGEDSPDQEKIDATGTDPGTKNVLIVDDSKMMCRALSDIVGKEPGLSVIGTAANGQEALEKIHALKPDLITLDVNMPVMGGETALKHIMIQSPCPVVIISSVGGEAPSHILDFLKLGAVDFIPKPGKAGKDSYDEERMIKRIKQAAHGKMDRFRRLKLKDLKKDRPRSKGDGDAGDSLIVICSGAGGYMELIELFSLLPSELGAPVLWIQDMPGAFCGPLADFVDKHSRIPVQTVEHTVGLVKGNGYVASLEGPVTLDDNPMALSASDAGPATAIDEFLDHLAVCLEDRLLVVLLSGAECGCLSGLEKVIGREGHVFVQSPDTCVAPGLLEMAIDKNLAEPMADTQDMIRRIIAWTEH